MMDPAIAKAILLKATHLQSYLMSSGHGKHSEDRCFDMVAALRLDLLPSASAILALKPYQMVRDLRARGLFRG